MEEARLRAGRGPFTVFWAAARFQASSRPAVMDCWTVRAQPVEERTLEFLLEFFLVMEMCTLRQ